MRSAQAASRSARWSVYGNSRMISLAAADYLSHQQGTCATHWEDLVVTALALANTGYHILGNVQRSIGYSMDGVSAKWPGLGTFDQNDQVLQTTQDALEEVKVTTSVTAAETPRRVGVKPAPCRAKASAMAKQPACAAAINSSGLVPFWSPKRVLKP